MRGACDFFLYFIYTSFFFLIFSPSGTGFFLSLFFFWLSALCYAAWEASYLPEVGEKVDAESVVVHIGHLIERSGRREGGEGRLGGRSLISSEI